MRLEGSLDAFGLSDVLHLLTGTGKTGALRLRRSGTTAVVRVRDGVLTGARADVTREDLGRRLVGLGAVAEASLREAVAAVTRTGAGLGPALRDVAAVDDALLIETATAVTVDAVAEVLRWPDGEFTFLAEETDPDDLGLVLDATEVLAEAARRLAEWPALLRIVPTVDSVPRVSAGVRDGTSATAAEWGLIALIDGRRPVRELVALTGRGEYAVTAQLVALAQRGLVTIRREALDADPVEDLARRQALLAPLEPTGAAPTAATPPAAGAPPAPPPPVPPALMAVPTAAAPALPLTVRSETVTVPAARLPHVVGSHPRSPENLVTVAPTSTPTGPVAGAAVACQPEPVPGTPDPAVARSLLLRLIAGVQGL